MDKKWIWNPKTKDSGIITCIPQPGLCPMGCDDCFFQSGRSYLEPLKENIPHIPSESLAEGRIVRINDGNDSNNNFDLVVEKTVHFKDKFYNTSINKNLDKFPGPVVLTVNPSRMTDFGFQKIIDVPVNLMFIRVRTNMWNIDGVVEPVVDYYTKINVPVILTYMAYYQTKIPKDYQDYYSFEKRTLNSYHVLNEKGMKLIRTKFQNNTLVYECGYKGTHSCIRCGNCIREYYRTKEKINNLNKRSA